MSLNSSLYNANSEALTLSQQTGQYIQNHANTGTTGFPVPFVSKPESSEVWLTYERLLLSCLRTGDDKAAHDCLEKLIARFGATNERVMGLRGLYQEAVAKDDAALERILEEYHQVLAEDPVNTVRPPSTAKCSMPNAKIPLLQPVAKRRIALLRNLSRVNDAIDALVELLESSPTDIEAWAELADLYLAQDLFSQAIFCFEEILLVSPNAWNVHARLGEALFRFAISRNDSSEKEMLAEAMRRFCRSIELCDDYLRGFYGLKMTSDRLLTAFPDDSEPTEQSVSIGKGDLSLPLTAIVHELNERATSKLAQITRQANAYQPAESIAAKELLDRTMQARQR